MSSVCSAYESRLADFDRQIASNTAKITALENERQTSTKAIDKIRPRLSYRRFARRIRLPAQGYSLWRPGLYLVAPAFTAATCYIAFDLLSSSGAFIFGSTLFGVLLSVGVLATLLNYPPDSLLPTQIAEMEAKQRQLEEAQMRLRAN